MGGVTDSRLLKDIVMSLRQMQSYHHSLAFVHPFLQSPELLTGSKHLFHNWSNSPGCRDISDAFCVSRGPCCPYVLVHFWSRNVPPTLSKDLLNIPLDIFLFILSTSPTQSLKHLVADIMGQNSLPGHIGFNSQYCRTHTMGRLPWLRVSAWPNTQKPKTTTTTKNTKLISGYMIFFFRTIFSSF